jgi:hypothetical protein
VAQALDLVATARIRRCAAQGVSYTAHRATV